MEFDQLPRQNYFVSWGFQIAERLSYRQVRYGYPDYQNLFSYLFSRLERKEPVVVNIIAGLGQGKSTVAEQMKANIAFLVKQDLLPPMELASKEWGSYIIKGKDKGLIRENAQPGFLSPQEFNRMTILLGEEIDAFMERNQGRAGICFVATPTLSAVSVDKEISSLPFPEAIITERYVGLNRFFTGAQRLVSQYQGIVIGLEVNAAMFYNTFNLRRSLKDLNQTGNISAIERLLQKKGVKPSGINYLELAKIILETSGTPEAMLQNRRQTNGLILWLDRCNLLPLPKTHLKIQKPDDFDLHPYYWERSMNNFLLYLMRDQLQVPWQQAAILSNRRYRGRIDRYPTVE